MDTPEPRNPLAIELDEEVEINEDDPDQVEAWEGQVAEAETAWLTALEECDRAIDSLKKAFADERKHYNDELKRLEKQRQECLDEVTAVRAGTSDRLPGM